MALTLKIENYDRLDDGGPAQYVVDQAGVQVGRGSMMDWVLPDPARHVSSHHFDIAYLDGAYWLTDVSTNGTFLQGNPYRLDGPHKLADGDRFQAGPYIIVALLGAPVRAAPQHAAPQTSDADPWALAPAKFEPVDPLPQPSRRMADDFGDSFIASPLPPAAQPQTAAPSAPPPPVAAPPVPPGVPASAPAAPAPPAIADSAIVEAFCKGAGLDPSGHRDTDALALAQELGRAMRHTAQELMAMLQDRAAAKQFTRGGSRTMLGASDNNPLKFMPDSVEALEALFLKPRPGFLTGADGLGDALRDIRAHQAAVFAAIQPALAQLLSDLSPEAVEADTTTGGMLGGSRKAKSWDRFVTRWDAKAQAHENGMLDVFLAHFAEAYAKANDGQG